MSSTQRVLTHFVLCLCFGAGGERPVFLAAQVGGGIGGHVRDTTGRVMHGVSVTLTPEAGGQSKGAMTDAQGAYRVEDLAEGVYRVDFDLRGFNRTRRNHVRPRVDAVGEIDATLTISPICECISRGLASTARAVPGVVLDEAGTPLPHARVELVSPVRRETSYTDAAGRFLVRTPVEGEWPITASDSGFSTVTQQISKGTTGPIVFRLRFVGTARVPPVERFALGCLCPEYFASVDTMRGAVDPVGR